MSEGVTYTVRMRPICFISDYGLTDVLKGTCHSVMKGIAPGATIIDVTHTVPGFDVIQGAEALRHATRYMPEDSVYLAVVDPGDKTKRRALAAEDAGTKTLTRCRTRRSPCCSGVPGGISTNAERPAWKGGGER